jgi:HTH-type transcriptional regulator/antitoxin MqsA
MSGRTPPSDAAVGLIEILARHPEEVATLRSFRMATPKAMTPDPRSSGAKSPVGKRIKRGVRNAAA